MSWLLVIFLLLYLKSHSQDAAAINDVEGKEVDEVDVRAELDEGSKSNENDLNYLFLKMMF